MFVLRGAESPPLRGNKFSILSIADTEHWEGQDPEIQVHSASQRLRLHQINRETSNILPLPH